MAAEFPLTSLEKVNSLEERLEEKEFYFNVVSGNFILCSSVCASFRETIHTTRFINKHFFRLTF